MVSIKLLLIEDDIQMSELLSRFLMQNEIDVVHVLKPSQALIALEVEEFDIIILDLSLPEIDGLDLCIQIRKITDVYILISSARSALDDKLIGFKNGADDYLPKPYNPKELLARIKSALKRTNISKKSFSNNSYFCINELSTQILFNGVSLNLTLAEYEILKLLINKTGQTVSRESIANNIDSHRFDSGIESINILIGRIRKKLDSNNFNKYIQTVRGIGYRFVEK